jgi:uncharacterized protein YyaL (SSP411 family)
MIRLSRITGDSEGAKRADRLLRTFARPMEVMPSATAQLLLALDLHLAEPQEIAVVGPIDHPMTGELRMLVDQRFLPHAVFLQGSGHGDHGLAGLEGKTLVDGEPAAYVCSNFTCKAPVTTAVELGAVLDG